MRNNDEIRLKHMLDAACEAWADIIGMRHQLSHAYFDIDLEVVWQTTVHDLPPPMPLLESALGTTKTPRAKR